MNRAGSFRNSPREESARDSKAFYFLPLDDWNSPFPLRGLGHGLVKGIRNVYVHEQAHVYDSPCTRYHIIVPQIVRHGFDVKRHEPRVAHYINRGQVLSGRLRAPVFSSGDRANGKDTSVPTPFRSIRSATHMAVVPITEPNQCPVHPLISWQSTIMFFSL